MSPKRYDPPKYVYPDENSDDELWYKPINEGVEEPKPAGTGVYFVYYSCDSCVVNWKQWISDEIRPRCFCCGRYQRKTMY